MLIFAIWHGDASESTPVLMTTWGHDHDVNIRPQPDGTDYVDMRIWLVTIWTNVYRTDSKPWDLPNSHVHNHYYK